MNRIKILDEKVINQIAAGEIIERPASIVKELMENSLDAKASKITINLEQGGKKLIEVIDNGSGMLQDDVLLAIERHATSKIYSIEDINHISTLGFRGEALPSIAAVSNMEIITLPQNAKEQIATDLKISNGKMLNVSKVAANPGTTVRVKNLFQNLPARRKFLKTIQTEKLHIIKIVEKLACTQPETSFKLFHNGREILNYPHVSLLERRIMDIFGKDFLDDNVIPFQKEIPEAKIHGFIGNYSQQDITWNQLHYIFINERYINDKIVYSSIKKAYEPFSKKILKKNEIPLFIIFLYLPLNDIDFNVSPTKSEVRFKEANLVFNFVKNTVTETLLNFERRKYKEFGKQDKRKTGNKNFNKYSKQLWKNKNTKKTDFKNQLDQLYNPRKEVQLKTLFNDNVIKKQNRIIETEIVNPWQVGNSFIMVESKNGIIIIDQHAAHERVLYEKTLKKLNETDKSSSSQKLLFPLVLELPKFLQKKIPLYIEKHSELFKKAGFKIKIFSGGSLIVDEIPQDMQNWNNGEALINIFKEIEEEFKSEMDFAKKLAQSIACHTSIKANQKLSKKEMLELINRLFATDNPFVCPHGRPTIIEISFHELNKRFKRI